MNEKQHEARFPNLLRCISTTHVRTHTFLEERESVVVKVADKQKITNALSSERREERQMMLPDRSLAIGQVTRVSSHNTYAV